MTGSATLRRFAPAKINLFLHVGDKRADGYHDLQSLVVFADIGDRLTATPARELSLNISGPFRTGLSTGEDNLVLKAARSLSTWAAAHGAKVSGLALSLEKNLPLASGVGGGSSDAAATLLMLAEHWSLPIAIDDLERVALSLGADVPVCMRTRPTMMSGMGERLLSADAIPAFALLLVNPGVEIPTAQIFASLRTRTGGVRPPPFTGASTHDFALWLDRTTNDLEGPATGIAPVITRVRAAITAAEGCLLARMSGSGATCFGIFEDDRAAQSAADGLSRAHPDWWIKAAPQYAAS